MDAAERFTALLGEAAPLPYDAQVPVLEDAVHTADAALGPAEQAEARILLVQAYQFGGRPQKVLVPFAWLRERLDAHDRHLGPEEVHAILWMNKWIVPTLASHPDVSLAHLRAAQADMRNRYERQGQGLGPVLQSAYALQRATAGPAAAHADYEAWVASPRTQLSDCEACEPGTRAAHLAALGRHAEAVAEVEHVLAREIVCEDQPESTIASVLPSLVAIGRGDEAAELHALAWRFVKDRPGDTDLVAGLVLFCARTGNAVRGLDLLRARLGDLDAPASPHDGLMLAAAGARLLEGLAVGGHGDLPVTPDGPTATELAATLRARATRDAEAFDARNGNHVVSDAVRDVLEADDLGHVDLGAPARGSLTGVLVPERSTHPLAPDPAGVDPRDHSALFAAVEAAQRWCGEAPLITLTDAWESVREGTLADLATTEDKWDLEALAALESLAARFTDDAERSRDRGASAAQLYRRAGQVGQALLAEQRVALVADDEDTARSLAEEVERVGTLAEVLRSRARLIDLAPDEVAASDLIDSMVALVPPDGDQWRARDAVAAALATRVDADPALALVAHERGLALLGPDECPATRGELLLARSDVLAELERDDEARADLDAAARVAWDSGQPVLWARVLERRAHEARLADDLGAAEELLAEAAGAALGTDTPDWAAALLAQQADVLSALGRPAQAAEVAERAVGLAVGAQQVAAIAHAAAGHAERSGDLRRARALAAEAVRAHAELGPSADAIGVLGHLGHLQWRQGDVDQSLATFDAALAQARSLDEPFLEASVHRWSAKPLFERDGADAALTALDGADARLASAEAAALTDWDVDAERLEVRLDRARVLGEVERYADALSALGDPGDYADDDALGEQARFLAEALREDLAEQQRQAAASPAKGAWRKLFGRRDG